MSQQRRVQRQHLVHSHMEMSSTTINHHVGFFAFGLFCPGQTGKKFKSLLSTDVQTRADQHQLLFKRVNETRRRGRAPGTDAVTHLSDSFIDDSKTPENRSVRCRVKPKVFVMLPQDLATRHAWQPVQGGPRWTCHAWQPTRPGWTRHAWQPPEPRV